MLAALLVSSGTTTNLNETVSALSLELSLELVDLSGIDLSVDVTSNSDVNVQLLLLSAVSETALVGGDLGNNLVAGNGDAVDLADDSSAVNSSV